jgi:hypothetical protein
MKNDNDIPATETATAIPERAAKIWRYFSHERNRHDSTYYSLGPTFHFAWKLATIAKHVMAQILSSAIRQWNATADLDAIICKGIIRQQSSDRASA